MGSFRAAPWSLLALTACPTAIESGDVEPVRHIVEASEEDSRVARAGEDLYPRESLHKSAVLAEGPLPEADPTASPGTGTPDESNGKCRLFAPRLKDPTCCEANLGFDAADLSAACKLPT